MTGAVDILILGAGWTSTFLIPRCVTSGITYAATRRSPVGPDEIQFTFDPESDDPAPYASLPVARTVLITFPIRVSGASERLVTLYAKAHKSYGGDIKTQFVQLGSTGVWDGSPTLQALSSLPKPWFDRHSPILPENERGRAETELLSLDQKTSLTAVLDLAGLWGGSRNPRNWVERVAPTREALKNKGSLHLIHGDDVARAVLAVHHAFDKAAGQRWLLTDGRIYDWWDLASAWGTTGSTPGPSRKARQAREAGATVHVKPPPPAEDISLKEDAQKEADEDERGPHARWVRELLHESGVRALPRTPDLLDRALDSREFWYTFALSPLHARIE